MPKFSLIEMASALQMLDYHRIVSYRRHMILRNILNQLSTGTSTVVPAQTAALLPYEYPRPAMPCAAERSMHTAVSHPSSKG